SILVEPWGGTNGSEWNYKLKYPIKEILIAHGEVIDSIIFRTIGEEGIINSPKFGGSGGDKRLEVTIENAPREYLIGINGTLGHYAGNLVVKSLCFTTNLKTYAPFGTKASDGTKFSLVMKEGGAIVGFHGRSSWYLDAIGVYLQQVTTFTQVEKVVPKKPKIEETAEFHDNIGVMITLVPRSAGPWGGCSGKPWDDGVFTTITRVILHVDTCFSAITGLEVHYVKEKASRRSHRGDRVGSDGIIINIDGENEFLIGVDGFYGPAMVENFGGSTDAIKQITFYTNKRKFGPYGRDIGTYFRSAAARGRIVGFHGRSGACLYAIGVHMDYF
ncbi:agglutinin, partial [Nicotiana attenuata]